MTPFSSPGRTATISLTPLEEEIVRLEGELAEQEAIRSILKKLAASLRTQDALLGPAPTRDLTKPVMSRLQRTYGAVTLADLGLDL